MSEQIMIFKLASGEEIIGTVVMGTVHSGNVSYANVKKPLQINKQLLPDGRMTMMFLPWTQLFANEEAIVPINNRHIVYELEPNEDMKKKYAATISKIIVPPPGTTVPKKIIQ